jgi:hypothetical protein
VDDHHQTVVRCVTPISNNVCESSCLLCDVEKNRPIIPFCILPFGTDQAASEAEESEGVEGVEGVEGIEAAAEAAAERAAIRRACV